jgi:zinc protease
VTAGQAAVRGFRFTGAAIAGLAGTLTIAGAQGPDRSAPPTPGPPAVLTLPAVEKHALSNGLPVWLIESHEVPLVQVNVTLLTGSSDDPTGKFGLASLTAAMLDEGAGKRPALEISDAIDVLGASLTTASSFDSTSARLNVPVRSLEDALPILADVVLRPAFAPPDLERLREERLTSLLQAQAEPSAIATTSFARLLFGTHRYGTDAIGTEQTVTSFTPADLKAFHAAHYVPSRAALVVVGDVVAEKLLPLLESEFGRWKGGGAVATPLPSPAPLAALRVVLVDTPGAAQSQVRVGNVGVARSTPDYFALETLNTVLGGSFTSRLNMNLREVHGYAYGASSAFVMRRSTGPFLAAANVQTDKTAEAVREMLNELDAIRTPIPAPELSRATNNLALGFPAEFETTTQLSRKLEELIVYDLPDEYFSRYVAGVRSVTAGQVQEAAATYIVPSKVLVLVVGDRQAVETGLRALNLAPLEVMTVAEATGRR